MAEIWTMGEMIVEIMREKEDVSLYEPGTFIGPYPSGAPAIFISTAARLGHKTGIIGGVGVDEFGKCLLDRLNDNGVDTTQVLQDEMGSTGCAFVMYMSDGDRRFLYHIADTPAASPKAPEASVFEGAKYFHIMGCSLMAKLSFGEEIVKAMHNAMSMGAKVSFDPNVRMELFKDPASMKIIREVMDNTNIFLPGVGELQMLSGEQDIEKAVAKCFENPNLEILVLKRGSKGATVYTRERAFDIGIYSVPVVDATGAGDSFDAAFVCSVAEGQPLEVAAKRASIAGALNTAAFGPMEGKISVESVQEAYDKDLLRIVEH